MAVTEQAFIASPIAAFGGKVIASPFQFTTDADDNLRIVSACSVAGVVLTLQGRRVDETGAIVPFSYTHTPNSDRSTKQQDFEFGTGALLNLTVFASAGTPLVGQCYVIVQLIKGLSGATIVLGTLLAGYVTAHQALGYPGSPIVTSTSGEPAIVMLFGTQPAVGAELSQTVPSGARWELLSMLVRFVASAVVVTRTVGIGFNTGGTPWPGLYIQTTKIGPSENWLLSWGESVGVGAVSTGAFSQFSSLPTQCILPSGTVIKTLTAAIDPGDQFTAPNLLFREWLEVS